MVVTRALGHKIGAAAEDVDGTTALEADVVVVLHWDVVWSNLEEFEQTLEKPNAIHMPEKRDERSEEAEVVAHGWTSGATLAAPEMKPELVWTPLFLAGGATCENGVARSPLLSQHSW
jgi:hypothetical protein